MSAMTSTRIAERLMQEHAGCIRFTPLAAGAGVTTLDAAYDVQREYVRLQRAARGVAPAGYKIGLTSPAMQAMCGIAHPVAGVVLADRLHASGAALRRADYGRLGIEFEIAVRLARDVGPADGRAPGLDEIAAAVDALAPAVEVVDTIGAGDSFHAALLFALREQGRLPRAELPDMTQAELRRSLSFAAACAAVTGTRPGADPPRWSEMAATWDALA